MTARLAAYKNEQASRLALNVPINMPPAQAKCFFCPCRPAPTCRWVASPGFVSRL